MPGAVIGAGCSLGQNVVVMPGTRIGNNVKIQNNVSVYEGVELEDDVLRSELRLHECDESAQSCEPEVGVSAHLVRREPRSAPMRPSCGATIGEYAFIGAGAVVRGEVPPYAVMVGVPARRVGWMCRCGIGLTLTGASRIALAADPGTGRRRAGSRPLTRRGDAS